MSTFIFDTFIYFAHKTILKADFYLNPFHNVVKVNYLNTSSSTAPEYTNTRTHMGAHMFW